MKSIEQHFKESRDQFDIEAPPPEVWQQVKHRWKKKTKRPSSFWQVAASLLLIVTLGLLLKNQQLESKVYALANLSDVSPEYAQLEQRYVQQIKVLAQEIPYGDLHDMEEVHWLFAEWQTLDSINQGYRNDLQTGEDQERIAQALIDQYEKRIQLLELIKLEIEKRNNEKYYHIIDYQL